MEKRRVVITGVGVVCSLGTDKEQYFQGLMDGVIGVDRITAFDASTFPSQIGAEIADFSFKKFVPKSYRKAAKLMSRDIELAIAAADLALRDAQVKTKGTCPDEEPNVDSTRIGVNIGAASICCDLTELGAAIEHSVEDGRFSYRKWGKEGIEALTPLWLLKYLPNMLGCHVSIIHDLQGPSNSVTCAE
ncbi:MAG: beta-ketoacyl-[acyl-carrier-protein] synthase family protein, partial [Planctomycetes bacterium]|nr:beta-ketoacyl-[acyl-carrier-protein] synthase family protein [Planctomycetota bacterium]